MHVAFAIQRDGETRCGRALLRAIGEPMSMKKRGWLLGVSAKQKNGIKTNENQEIACMFPQ